ncbi:MAG TPA: hypothetical protein VJX23_06185 [Candidatus Binataceae bacterium]|nr:hypothetical protein [Candidatus Binataceae bacterium]
MLLAVLILPQLASAQASGPEPLSFSDPQNCENKDLELLDRLGIDFWQLSEAGKARGDSMAEVRNAEFTATALGCFYVLVAEGKLEPQKVAGTLAILGKAYLTLGNENRAYQIYEWLVGSGHRAHRVPRPAPDPGGPDYPNVGSLTSPQTATK